MPDCKSIKYKYFSLVGCVKSKNGKNVSVEKSVNKIAIAKHIIEVNKEVEQAHLLKALPSPNSENSALVINTNSHDISLFNDQGFRTFVADRFVEFYQNSKQDKPYIVYVDNESEIPAELIKLVESLDVLSENEKLELTNIIRQNNSLNDLDDEYFEVLGSFTDTEEQQLSLHQHLITSLDKGFITLDQVHGLIANSPDNVAKLTGLIDPSSNFMITEN